MGDAAPLLVTAVVFRLSEGKRCRHGESWIPLSCCPPRSLQSPNPSQSITLFGVVIKGCYRAPEERSSGEKRSRNADSLRCPCSAWQVWHAWRGNPGLLARDGNGKQRMGAEAVPGVRECWITPQAVSLNVKIYCFSVKPKYRVAVEVTVAFSPPGFRMKSKSGE